MKGGGGALTREKIVAAASQTFVCIVGVVTVGLFALRPADVLLLGTPAGVQTLSRGQVADG